VASSSLVDDESDCVASAHRTTNPAHSAAKSGQEGQFRPFPLRGGVLECDPMPLPMQTAQLALPPAPTPVECGEAPASHTVFWTVVAGVTVFIVGQMIQRWLIDPVNDLRALILKIADTLIYECPMILSARSLTFRTEDTDRVERALRAHASALRVRGFAFPWTARFLIAVRFIRLPSKASLERAAQRLMWLSNSFRAHGTSDQQIDAALRAIESNLGLPHTETG